MAGLRGYDAPYMVDTGASERLLAGRRLTADTTAEDIARADERVRQYDSQFSAGIGTGLRSISYGAKTAVAQALKAAGYKETGDSLMQQANIESEQAARFAPRVQSLRDVNSSDSFGDYIAGTVGQGVATILPTMAAAIASRGAGLRPSAQIPLTMAPSVAPMIGESVQALNDDPVASNMSDQRKLALSLGMGLGGAAAEAFVPHALVNNAIKGNLVSKLAKAHVGEGLSEVASNEVNRQVVGAINPNRDTSSDMMDRIDEAAAGIIGGAPVIAPTGVAAHMLGKGADAASGGIDALRTAQDKAAPVYDAVKNALGKVTAKGKDAASGITAEDVGVAIGGAARKTSDAVSNLYTRLENRLVQGSTPELDSLLSVQQAPVGVDVASWIAQDDTARNATAKRLALKYISDENIPMSLRKAATEAIYGSDTDAGVWMGFSEVAQRYERDKKIGEGIDKLSALFHKAGIVAGKAARVGYNVSRRVYDGARKGRENAMSVQPDAAFDDLFTKTFFQNVASAGSDNTEALIKAAQVAPQLKQWVLNGFSATEGGEIFMPAEIVDLLGPDPKSTITSLYKLAENQGILNDEGAMHRVAAAQQAIDRILATDNIVEEYILPTAQAKYNLSGEDHRAITGALESMLKTGKYDEALLDELFGHNKDTVLEALSEGTEYQDPAARNEIRESDGDNPDDEINDDVIASMTNVMAPSEVKARVEYHGPYNIEAEGNARAGLEAKRKQLAGQGKAVSTIGAIDHIFETHRGDDAAIIHNITKFIAENTKYLNESERAKPELHLNRKMRIVRAEDASDKQDTIDIPGSEFDAVTGPLGARNKWGMSAGRNNEFGGADNGRIWFESVNNKVDRETGAFEVTQFNTSAARIISRMREAQKDTGGDIGHGLVAQRRLLLQGISSMLNSKNADGRSALSGNIGIMVKGKIQWIQADNDKAVTKLLDQVKLYDGTIADAEKQMDKEVAENNREELTAWVERNSRFRSVDAPVKWVSKGDVSKKRNSEVKVELQEWTEADEANLRNDIAALKIGTRLSNGDVVQVENKRELIERAKDRKRIAMLVTAAREALRDNDAARIAKAVRAVVDDKGDLGVVEGMYEPPQKSTSGYKKIEPEITAKSLDMHGMYLDEPATDTYVDGKGRVRKGAEKPLRYDVTPSDEAEQKADAEEKKHSSEVRIFDELTGEELHPRESRRKFKEADKQNMKFDPEWKDVPRTSIPDAIEVRALAEYAALRAKNAAQKLEPEKLNPKQVEFITKQLEAGVPAFNASIAKQPIEKLKAIRYVLNKMRTDLPATLKTRANVVLAKLDARISNKVDDSESNTEALGQVTPQTSDITNGTGLQHKILGTVVSGLPEILRHFAKSLKVVPALAIDGSASRANADGSISIASESLHTQLTWAPSYTQKEANFIRMAHEAGHQMDRASARKYSNGLVNTFNAARDLYASKSSGIMKQWLSVVFDPEYYGSQNAQKQQRELFAQLTALHALDPKLLKSEFPRGHKYMERVHEHAVKKIESARAEKVSGERHDARGGVGQDTQTDVARGREEVGRASGRRIDAADQAQGVRENAQNTETPPKAKKEMPRAERAALRAEITKMLGDDIAVEFKRKLLGSSGAEISGDWQEGLIRISLHAEDPAGVGAHEAMHEFFSRLLKGEKNVDVARVKQILLNVANSPAVVRQLERLLDKHPNALAQINKDSEHHQEERLAYAYQFYRGGLLTLGPETESIFQKIANFIRKVVGLLTDVQKAERLFDAFSDGRTQTADAAAEVLANSIEYRERVINGAVATIKPIMNKVNKLVQPAQDVLLKSGNPALVKILTTFKQPTGEGVPETLFEAQQRLTAKYTNAFESIVRGYQPKDLEMAAEYLHAGKEPTDAIARDIYTKVRALLDELETYVREAGVKVWDAEADNSDAESGKGQWVEMGHRKNYYPRSYDVSLITADAEGFIADLLSDEGHKKEIAKIVRAANKELERGETNPKSYASMVEKRRRKAGEAAASITERDIAIAITNRILNGLGQADVAETESAVGFEPFMRAVNRRSLHWLNSEHMAKWLNKDMADTMTTYIAQSVKRAEYVRRLDNGGSKLSALMDDALAIERSRIAESDPELSSDELTTEALKRLEEPAKAIMALEGTLGYDVPAWLRNVGGIVGAYENIRLLSTALFSQMIDPLGIVIRGGEMSDAWATYKRGIREVWASWKGKRITDVDTEIAESIGTVEAVGFLATFGQQYSSMYLNKRVRKINDGLFKYNGMEGFNRAARIQATSAAIKFLKRHKQLPDGDVSREYLHELRLEPEDIKVAKDGSINYQDPKVAFAIKRWVDGAIMRPNAAQRTVWMSDPHYMMFAHMKQFAYTMHDVILKRVMKEAKSHDNMAPLAVVASFVPMMIAADTAKSLLLTGNAPTWSHDLGETILHGANRAGLAGMYQPFADVALSGHGVASLAGPAAEQVSQLFTQPLGESFRDALPGQNVLNMVSK